MAGGNEENVVLDEAIDENWEPTFDEIQEYAVWLGMDKDKDQDLFYIAKEGLKAPLPPPWKPCKTGDGEIFYFNFSTGESVWDHPCDEFYRKQYEQAKSDRDNKVTDNAAPPRKEEKKKKDKEEKRKSSVKDVSSLGVPGSLPGNLGSLGPAKTGGLLNPVSKTGGGAAALLGGPKELGAKKDERKSDLGKTTEANRPAPLNSDLGAGSLRRSSSNTKSDEAATKAEQARIRGEVDQDMEKYRTELRATKEEEVKKELDREMQKLREDLRKSAEAAARKWAGEHEKSEKERRKTEIERTVNSWAADHEREEKKKQSEAMERADREHTRALSNLQSEHEEKCKRIKADQQAELNRIERQYRDMVDQSRSRMESAQTALQTPSDTSAPAGGDSALRAERDTAIRERDVAVRARDDARRERDDLERDRTRALDDQRRSLETKVSDADRQVQDLRRELEDERDRARRAAKDLESRAERAEADAASAAASSARAGGDAAAQQAAEDLIKARQELSKLRQDLDEAQSDARKAKEEQDRARSETTRVQADLDLSRSELNRAKDKSRSDSEAAEADAKRARDEVVRLREDGARELEAAQRKVAKAEEAARDAESAQSGQLTALQEQLETARTEAGTAKSKLRSTETELKMAESNLRSVQAELTSTSSELTATLEKLSSRPDADSQARALQKLRQELAAEKAAALEKQRLELESKADAAPAPTDLTREITDPAALRVAEQKAKDAKAEAQRLKEQLSQSQDETQRAKQDLQRAEAEAQRAKADLQRGHFSDLQRAIVHPTSSGGPSAEELQRANSEVAAATEEARKAGAAKDEALRAHAESQRTVGTLEARCAALQQQLSSASLHGAPAPAPIFDRTADNLRAEVRELGVRLAEKDREIARLEDLRRVARSTDEDLTKVQVQLRQAEEQVREAERARSTAVEELRRSQLDAARSRDRLDGRDEAEQARLEHDAKKAKHEVRLAQDELAEREREAERLRSDLRRAKGEMREKDRELGDLRLEVAAKEKEAQQLRTSSELTGRSEDLELRRKRRELADKEAEVDDKASLLKEKERALREAETLLVQRRRELDREGERLDREEEELERIKTALRTVSKDLRAHVLAASETGVQPAVSVRETSQPRASSRALSAHSERRAESPRAEDRASKDWETDEDWDEDSGQDAPAPQWLEREMGGPAASGLRQEKDFLKQIRRALEVERARWRADMKACPRGNVEDRRVLKDVKVRLDLCTKRLNDQVRDMRAASNARGSAPHSARGAPTEGGLAEKWKHFLEEGAPAATPRETPRLDPKPESAASLAERWKHLLDTPDARPIEMAFNPTPRDQPLAAGYPGTFTPRGKARQDRRTDAVSGQFRQWAMGRSSLQQQLSQHSAWLRDLKREVSSR